LTALLGISGLLLMTEAEAKAVDAASAAAVVLQDRGRDLMTKGKTKEGCAALAESARLDPAPETFLALAQCHEKIQAPAAAWSDLRNALTYARSAGDRASLSEAQKRLAELEPHLSYIKIVVPLEQRVPELRVALDGVVLHEGAWDTFLPVEPGAHEISAETRADRRVVYRVSVDTGARKQTVVIELERASPPRPAVTPMPALAPDVNVVAEHPAPGERSGTALPTSTLVAGAVGMTALLGGVGLALAAKLEWSHYQSACPGDRCANQGGIDSAHAAARYALLADVSFGVGIAASALALYFAMQGVNESDPRNEPSRVVPALSPGAAGVMFEGTW
jgi:hypothetical protein